MTWRDRFARYGGLLIAAVFIGCMGLECSGFARQEPPRDDLYWQYGHAYRINLFIDGKPLGYEGSFGSDTDWGTYTLYRMIANYYCRPGVRVQVQIWDSMRRHWLKPDLATKWDDGGKLFTVEPGGVVGGFHPRVRHQ